MNKEYVKSSILELVDRLAKKAFWSIKNSPELRFPVRKVEVTRSPWYKHDAPNYCVCFYYNDELMECENGLTKDSAIKAVWSWYNNSGFLPGRPIEVEEAVMGA